jgi:hypothetical protein
MVPGTIGLPAVEVNLKRPCESAVALNCPPAPSCMATVAAEMPWPLVRL